MHANEEDIQHRIEALEKSLGSILPQSRQIEEIVHRAEEEQVRQNTEQIESAMKENPVFRKKAKVFI